MKTIEERAIEFTENYKFDDGYYGDYVVDGYEAGAKDQKIIDIKKACKWIEVFMKAYDVDDPITPNESLFREAMED